jgi:hypothetical protein
MSAHPIFLGIGYPQPIQHSWVSDVLSPSNIIGHCITCQPTQYSWAMDIISPSIILDDQISSAHPISLDIRSPISPSNILGDQIHSAHPTFLGIRSAQPIQYCWTSDHLSAHPIFLGIRYAQPIHYFWESDVASQSIILGYQMFSYLPHSLLPYPSAHPIFLDIPAEICWPNNIGLVSTSAGPIFLGSDGLKGLFAQ